MPKPLRLRLPKRIQPRLRAELRGVQDVQVKAEVVNRILYEIHEDVVVAAVVNWARQALVHTSHHRCEERRICGEVEGHSQPQRLKWIPKPVGLPKVLAQVAPYRLGRRHGSEDVPTATWKRAIALEPNCVTIKEPRSTRCPWRAAARLIETRAKPHPISKVHQRTGRCYVAHGLEDDGDDYAPGNKTFPWIVPQAISRNNSSGTLHPRANQGPGGRGGARAAGTFPFSRGTFRWNCMPQSPPPYPPDPLIGPGGGFSLIGPSNR